MTVDISGLDLDQIVAALYNAARKKEIRDHPGVIRSLKPEAARELVAVATLLEGGRFDSLASPLEDDEWQFGLFLTPEGELDVSGYNLIHWSGDGVAEKLIDGLRSAQLA